MYRKYVKVFFDFIIALIALIILLPIFLIVVIAIRIDSKGNAFFLQERLGLNGKVFKVFKFRSMSTAYKAENGVNTLQGTDPRITKVGGFIRKTSIDELPQVINILLGDMSFIGPRPPLTKFPKKFEDYNEFEVKRFNVKPGISGLAQIRCREEHDWSVNIPIDVEYVSKQSFLFDMDIFVKSLFVFFKTDNIYTKTN
jgi:lipopolysaccharide/colanic/teichoic acid biosynthesis glycosyltransferase